MATIRSKLFILNVLILNFFVIGMDKNSKADQEKSQQVMMETGESASVFENFCLEEFLLSVQEGLKKQSEKDSSQKKLGMDWFWHAAQEGWVNHLAKYLDNGWMHIDDKLHFGTTALMTAAARGKLEAVKFLISRGANPMIVGKERFYEGTARDFAARKGYKEIVDLLSDYEISWMRERYLDKTLRHIVIPKFGNKKNVRFNDAWTEAESNADRIYLLEKALDKAENKKEVSALEFYIDNSSILPYLKKDLKEKADTVKSKL